MMCPGRVTTFISAKVCLDAYYAQEALEDAAHGVLVVLQDLGPQDVVVFVCCCRVLVVFCWAGT